VNNNVTNNAYVYNGRGYAAPGYGYAANPVATTAIVAGTAAVVGAAAANSNNAASAPVYAEPTVTVVAALPCDTGPVVYNDISFYQCGSAWFTRAYVSGSVAYVVSSPPPGR
jgi:hypothetical protein